MSGLVALLLLVALVAGIVIVIVGADRYRPRPRSNFVLPTHEVFVDPVTRIRQRVYVDPTTGERAYVDEPEPMTGSPIPPLERPGLMAPPRAVGPPGAPGPTGYLAPPPPDRR